MRLQVSSPDGRNGLATAWPSSSETAAHSSPSASATMTSPRGTRLESSWASSMSASVSSGRAWRKVTRASTGVSCTGPASFLRVSLRLRMHLMVALRRGPHIRHKERVLPCDPLRDGGAEDHRDRCACRLLAPDLEALREAGDEPEAEPQTGAVRARGHADSLVAHHDEELAVVAVRVDRE